MIDTASYIEVYDNILDEKICDKIVERSSPEDFVPAMTGAEGDISDTRKSYRKILTNDFETNVFMAVGKILNSYIQDHLDFISSGSDTGYEHLLYKGEEKGEYKIHVDHYKDSPRILSCSIILNNDFKGGELSFFEEKNNIKFSPKKGSAIVFPSNFCFPHAVLPVTEGNRHSIVTWII
jgi:predicted 2-oxoglutarate/Fe(II)-dependent dioxygenase YbiX